MDFTTKQTCKNNDIEVIIHDNGLLWLNEKHVEEKLDRKNLRANTGKSPSEYRKQKARISQL